MQAIDPEDPEYTSFEVTRGLALGFGDFAIGSVRIPVGRRLSFLLTGRIEVASVAGGGTRFSLHTPRLRNLPLHLLARLTRRG